MFKVYSNSILKIKLTNNNILRKMSDLPMLKRKPSLSKEKSEKDRLFKVMLLLTFFFSFIVIIKKVVVNIAKLFLVV